MLLPDDFNPTEGEAVIVEDDARQQAPEPNSALGSLDVMVGTWDLKGRESGPYGEIHERPTFEWMEGGFFLVQHVGLDHIGNRIKGVEYIGFDESNEVLKSYFFSNTGPGPFGGVALEYVWDVDGDTLAIWGGFVGSQAAFKGKFGDDGNTITGRWEWPGGGYEAIMTRTG